MFGRHCIQWNEPPVLMCLVHIDHQWSLLSLFMKLVDECLLWVRQMAISTKDTQSVDLCLRSVHCTCV